MWGGGLPYCPRGRGPWGEDGISPPDDPFWASGRRSGHYVVVPALEDCTPDLQRGLVAVCRWWGKVIVGGAEAGGAEHGVAIGCGGLFPMFRLVPVCRVVLLRWGSSKACGSSVCDVDVGVLCEGFAPLDEEEADVLILNVLESHL